MRSSNIKNTTSKITELYIKWGQKSFLFTLVCIVWLAWRIGTKPSRLNYPCSQFALWQITLYFSSISTPLIGICHRCLSYIRERNYQKIGGIVLLLLVLTGTFSLYAEYVDNQLKIAGSGTIPASSSAISPQVSTTGIEPVSQYLDFPHSISPDHAVVSYNHDPLIDYGGTPPYDPEFNPAYDFVWETVTGLHLGSPTNPLDDLINTGDTVLIKPNWVDYGPAVYTRPEVIRPLIDMAIAAGATEIYIGDGGVGVPSVDYVINSADYDDMVSDLAALHPGITIETVNLCSHSDGWRWISLSENSSFAGSGISHADLGTGSESLYNHQYYTTSDNLGVNPGGDTLGWYAVNDRILEADVIINASKMKTHQLMMATMSIKNIVGCTISCTYNQDTMTQARIAHHPYPTPTEYNYFNNDIFWRAILDMNKIILYTDENGVFQPTQQRMYLNVVDGIQAMERSQHHSYGGGGLPYYRHVILAGVDPVAVDAVGCRIMGYDYSVIPSISNADSDIVHPVGINDPGKIVVLGDEIDSAINHVFVFNSAWNDDAVDINLGLTDFTPPSIHSISRVGYSVTANISDCLAAYIIYQADGLEYIEKMTEESNIYTGNISGTMSEYFVIAQDEYFNTTQSMPQSIEDTTPPYTSGHAPSPGEAGVPVDTNIVVHVQDDGEGVDNATITMTVEGVQVSPDITGNSTDYTLTYDPPADFNHLQVVDVTVNASDLATPANVMTEDSYSFTTIHEEYTLTVNTIGIGNVNIDPPGDSYPSGTVVELTANATPGSVFSGWSGDLSGSTNPTTIIMDSNKTVTAYFISSTGVEWSKTYGGYSFDRAHSVCQTTDGGYILTGYTKSFGAGDSDVWLIKTDAGGNKEWDKTFGGTSRDVGRSVCQTTDGGYVISGYTDTLGAGGEDFWLIRTDASGNLTWNTTFGGVNDDRCHSAQLTTDGGYVMVGETYSYGAGGKDVWLIKTDVSGNMTWSKTFGTSRSDSAYYVSQTSDGGYIFTGDTELYRNNSWTHDLWLVKTNGSGNLTWSKSYYGAESSTERGYCVHQTNDGGYIITGSIHDYDNQARSTDLWLLKTDSSGNEIWNKAFGDSGDDFGYSVYQVLDGGYLVVGNLHSSFDRAWLIKTDAFGNQDWNIIYNDIEGYGSSCRQTNDGGYIVAGSFGGQSADFWLLKLSVRTLNIGVGGNGSTSLTEGAHEYILGTNASITATPAAGWRFVNWTGDVGTLTDINAASTTITMDEDYAITANFAVIQQDGNGGGGGGGGGDTTSLSEYTTGSGKFVVDATASSADGQVNIEIPKDTVGKDRNGNRLRFITIKKQEAPSDPPTNCAFVCLTYDIGPSGVTLEPHGYLVFHYDDPDVPGGVAEEDLVLVTLQDGAWVELEGCIVNPDENTITAPVSHFSVFTAMAHTAPAEFELTGMTVVPGEVKPDEPVTVSVTVINTGDLTGSYELVLNISNTAAQDKSVTLKGGESQTVSFTVTQDTGGVYTVNIGDLSGIFTVKEPEGKAVAASVDETSEAAPTSQPAETSVNPTQPAEPAPTEKALTKPAPSQGIVWWLIALYIAGGVFLIGLVAYIIVRKRTAQV